MIWAARCASIAMSRSISGTSASTAAAPSIRWAAYALLAIAARG